MIIVKKYQTNGYSKYTKIPRHKTVKEMSEISNSCANEEVVKIVNGFRPDFAQEQPVEEQRPLRTMKTMKKKNKLGKRVLKRVYRPATSDQSSYSSLMSSYVDIDDISELQLKENALPLDEQLGDGNPQENGHMHPIPEEAEDSDKDSQSPSSPQLRHQMSTSSLPADEYFDSQANIKLEKNSPRESFKVFHQ